MQVFHLLGTYKFRLHVRRFIYEQLFESVLFTDDMLEQIAEPLTPPSTAATTTATAATAAPAARVTTTTATATNGTTTKTQATTNGTK